MVKYKCQIVSNVKYFQMSNNINLLMFVYICERSLVGIRDIPSQFGCSVFGQEYHHGTHDTSSHQAFPACKRDHHSAGERVRSYKIKNPKLSMPMIPLSNNKFEKRCSTRSEVVQSEESSCYCLR